MSLWRAIEADLAAEYAKRGWWSDRTLRQRVEANAKTYPENIAYSWDGIAITWAEYLDLTDTIALRLMASGSWV